MLNNEDLLRVLNEVKSLLDKEKIPFWLEAGTLLGAIRDKKIIPWDTDIDLAAFKTDFPDSRKRKLAQYLEKKGFIVHFFPNKIDIAAKSSHLTVHLIYGPKGGYFVWKRLGGNDKLGLFLLKICKLANVSYYGKFRFSFSGNYLLNLKTDLFKLITLIPKSVKNKFSEFALARLSNSDISGVYCLKIPTSYISKFKKIDFYGSSFNAPISHDKYLEEEYGDWRSPPKDPKKWFWYKNGNWKKIKSNNLERID